VTCKIFCTDFQIFNLEVVTSCKFTFIENPVQVYYKILGCWFSLALVEFRSDVENCHIFCKCFVR